MRSTRENQSSKVSHLVPNNRQADLQLTGGKSLDDKAVEDAKKKTLYDNIRSGSYKTHQGHWKQRDEWEPDAPSPTSASFKKHFAKDIEFWKKRNQQASARERLKRKSAVPLRNGKKLFDEFIKEANQYRQASRQKASNPGDLTNLRNAYNAATSLQFNQWLTLMDDLFGDR